MKKSGLLSQGSSLRLPLGDSGSVLTISNAACASLSSPLLLVVDASVSAASPLGELPLGKYSVGFYYLFIFPPGYVVLCASKAHHRLGSESVSWCLETSLFFKTLFPGWSSDPTSFVPLFIFYIFSYLLSKTMGCFPGCMMSSAGIPKLFLQNLLSV